MRDSFGAIPHEYHSLSPCLIVNNARQAIDFYKTVFGATECMRFECLDGKIGYAEPKIGDSKIMLGDSCAQTKTEAHAIADPIFSLYLLVEAVDAVVQKAVEAGATIVQPLENKF